MSMVRLGLIILAVGAAVCGALYFVTLRSGVSDSRSPTLRPDIASVVASGEVLYAAHCASCHGAELEGQPDWRSRDSNGLLPAPPHDETGHTWHHSDSVLFELTKIGPQRFAGADYQSTMPAYEGVLSDADIVAVLSFIKSTWPEDIRARQDAITLAE